MSNQKYEKIMKAIKCILVSLAALVFSACDLNERPDSFVDHATFYENVMQCRSAINSCYSSMKPIFTANYMMAVEGCTDLWYCTSSTVDAILDVSPAKPQMGKTVWQYGYQGVMRCNECIDCILNAKTNIEEEKKMALVAECVVLRAFYYYILTSFFGDVPFYTERVGDIATLEKVRRLPRMDANEIRQYLYDDINNYINYLPQQRTCEDPEARAGAALGYMLQAKFMMWNKEWTEALTPLLELEKLYGDLSQYPLHEIMWRYNNVPEGIFELQQNYAADGVQYYGNVACIMMPPHQGNGVFNGVALSGYGDTMTAWNSLRANNYLGIFRPAYAATPDAVQKKEEANYVTGGPNSGIYNPLPLTYDDNDVDADKNGIKDNVFFTSDKYRYYTKLDVEAATTGVNSNGDIIDKRIQYKLGLGNYETGETFTYTRQWGVPWPGPQFWCPNITATYDGNNYRLFRYADAILMLAECYCELTDDEASIRYLNMVKDRADIAHYENFSSFDELAVEIRVERGRELAGEFMRKYDLVRWGIWYEQTMAFSNHTNLKNKMKPCHRYYPIPDTQCGLSGGVLTNDEYTAEGMK